MTLFIRHGPDLAALADELAGHLDDPPGDPFEPVVVAVPTAGVRDWLGRHLAERLGVTANIRMPFPGRFVAAALGTPLDADDPWRVERLTWAVLDVLDSGAVEVPGWTRATRPSQSRRFAVARRLADLFDRYATIRPQLLQQWHVGAVGDGTVRVAGIGGAGDPGDDAVVGGLDPTMAWQFHLWRAVRAHIGTPSPAERLPELVQQLRSGVIEPALPSTIAVFGVGVFAPAQLDVVTALAEVRDVRLSVVHPSPVLWHRTTASAPGRLVTRRRFDESTPVPGDGHPLLRSWGRLGVETAALLRGVESAGDAVVAGVDAAVGESPATLLAHIQHDIRLDRPPTPYAATARAGDTSLQVHACHGVTRQLEVLRDVLGHLFVGQPSLQPRDVLIVCPDLDRFEPFAKAVFARGSLPLPLAVSDLSLGTENPVAAAMATVVRTVADRCTAVDVLAVAALEPVRQRLGISIDDVAQFAAWAERLGTSWGLDTSHRADWLDIEIPSGTWEASVRSLLVGAAMPAPEPRPVFVDIVPHDDIGADTLQSAGRLAELIARLRHCRDELDGVRSVAEWCDVLVELLGLLCAAAPDDAWQMAEVLNAIDRIRAESRVGDTASTVALDRSDVRALVDHLVAGSPGRLSLRSGRITMTGMVPVRNVPARVVCLLGFDEVSLRPPGVDGDDVLSLRPCVGERDRRAEQRQLVLDSVMAADDHLVVVCDGNDITTNRRMRFPVQLAELLDVVDMSIGEPSTRQSGIIVHHPLRAFDDRNFGDDGVTGSHGGVFGFDDTMRAAAEARRLTHDGAASPTPLRWSIAGPVPAAVTLAQLTEACTRPARTLLRDGLDVRLPNDVERQDSNIPLSVSPLESASLGQRLLDRYRIAASRSEHAGSAWEAVAGASVEEWSRSEALRAGNPPRQLIRQSLDVVRREVDQLVVAAAACDQELTEADIVGANASIDVGIPLRYTGRAVGTADGSSAATLAGDLWLADVVAGVAGSTICRLHYRRPKSRVIVAAALDLAAAVVSTGTGDWRALTVTRGASGTAPPACQLLQVVAAEPVVAAMNLLETAAEFRVAALTGAVPLFEEMSKDLHSNGFIDEETLLGNGFVPGDMGDPHTRFVWGSVTTAEMLRLTPTPLMLARMMWSAVYGLASITKPAVTTRTAR